MAARRRSTGSKPCLDHNNTDIGRQHHKKSTFHAEIKAIRENEKPEESAIILNHWYLFGVAFNASGANHD